MYVEDCKCMSHCERGRAYLFRRADIVDSLVDTATIHVTDLATLQHILAPTTSNHLATALNDMRVLSITLRLPLKEFDKIESPSAQPNKHPSKHTWPSTCSALANLQNLRKLHLWLDHDHTSSWSVVNERAFLRPLHDIANKPSPHISVNLPKTHPKHENFERHFLPSCDPPPFTITRRLRQGQHAVPGRKGMLNVKDIPDFPESYSGEDSEDDADFDRLAHAEMCERRVWETMQPADAEKVVSSQV